MKARIEQPNGKALNVKGVGDDGRFYGGGSGYGDGRGFGYGNGNGRGFGYGYSGGKGAKATSKKPK